MDLIIEISRSTVESMNIERGLHVLSQVGLALSTVATDAEGTFFALAGYDDDPRELFEIEEVRRFFRALIEADPELFYSTLAADRDSLPGYLFWTAVAYNLADENLQFSQYDCMEVMNSLGIPLTTGPAN